MTYWILRHAGTSPNTIWYAHVRYINTTCVRMYILACMFVRAGYTMYTNTQATQLTGGVCFHSVAKRPEKGRWKSGVSGLNKGSRTWERSS